MNSETRTERYAAISRILASLPRGRSLAEIKKQLEDKRFYAELGKLPHHVITFRSADQLQRWG